MLGTYVTLTRVIALALAALVTVIIYKRPGTFSYLSEVIAEMRKVTWPSIDETKRNTVVVIAFTIMLSGYLALFDWIWQIVTDFLITPGA